MNEVARRYAKALFSLTHDENQFAHSAALLIEMPALWSALKSPCVCAAEKCAVLERLLGASAEPLFLNFYQLLCRQGRIALLPEIRQAYHQYVLENENRGEARMRCVVPPTPSQQEALCKALCTLQKKAHVDLEIIEDSSLIGGFVLELDGICYDKSISGTLQDMLERLQAR